MISKLKRTVYAVLSQARRLLASHPWLDRKLSELGLEFDPRHFFHSDAYLRSTARRLEHLSTLKLPLHGRSVLEVGAGIGDLSHFYIDRGCRVTITEVRPGNLRFLRKRFPGQQVLQLDLDQPQPLAVPKHEVVHCYGLLYHLAQPELALDYLAAACQEILILETCVSFGNEDALNFLKEDVLDPTQASSGTGCRPTRAALLSRLKRHFAYVYVPRTQPNHREFPLDWNAPEKHEASLSRAIFVASRLPLSSDQLIQCDTSLPEQQERSA